MKIPPGSPPTCLVEVAKSVPILLHLASADVRLLRRLKEKRYYPSSELAGVTLDALRMGLLHWPLLKPRFLTDVLYMQSEGFENLDAIHLPRLNALALRGFKP